MTPDYQPHSAGSVVLHRLCHLLNVKGQSSFVTAKKSNPKWNNPNVLKNPRQCNDLIKKGAIVVYPEVVSGNPMRAKTVVRYVLNVPGLLGGDKQYDEDEIIFVYSKHLLFGKLGIKRILNIPSINTKIFYPPENEERTIEGLLYLGKYNDPINGPKVPKRPLKGEFFDKYKLITRGHPDQKTLGDWLRKCKVLYSYDNFSALNFEATLCGCLVVLIPDGIHSKDSLENSEYGLNGVAWGLSKDEIDRAKSTLKNVPHVLEQINKDVDSHLDNFIKLTQDAARNNLGKKRPSILSGLFRKVKK